MSGVKTSHSMGGARADRAPSVLQPPIPSHKPLGSGRTLARSYLAGFFRTRAHLPTRHHHRLPQVAASRQKRGPIFAHGVKPSVLFIVPKIFLRPGHRPRLVL
eukprot:scaffold12485_cov142-Isochrysis_galbana.AAC.3